MRPSRTIELSLHFASQMSPLWLLVLVPLVLALGFFLYYRELGLLPRRQMAIVVLLRLVLLGLILFGVFMPSVGVISKLRFPGRILLLVDNSESMTVSDSTLPEIDALTIARLLGGRWPERADSQTGFFLRSLELQELLFRGQRLQHQSADGGAYRDESLHMSRTTFLDLATAMIHKYEEEGDRYLPAERLSPQNRQEYKAFQGDIAAFRAAVREADIGALPVGSSASLREVCALLDRLVLGYRRFQRAVDEAGLSQGETVLREASHTVALAKRLDLVNRAIDGLLPAIRKWTPGQYIQVMDLMAGTVVTLGCRGGLDRPVEPVRGKTSIPKRLDQIISQPSPFPLTGVIVVSDGVDLSGDPMDGLLTKFVEQRVPISCAGVGHIEEPYDLAIAAVKVPPVVVKSQRLFVETHIKAAVPSPVAVKISICQGTQEAAAMALDLNGHRPIVYVPLTPQATGLQHYTVELQSTAADDAFRDRNNIGEFVIDVRQDQLRVLLLDDRPRWQTRFVLNALHRLPYVDVNSIIRMVQDKGMVHRGAIKGTWPRTRELLDIYDVVMVGRFDSEILSPDEWKDLESLVRDKGKILVFLAPGDTPFVPAFIQDLYPLAPPSVSLDGSLSPALFGSLRLTEEGALHPLTRSFRPQLALSPFPRTTLRPDAFVLLHDAAAVRPLLSCRFVGPGKVFMLHSDRLWSCLNQRHAEQHASVFVNLVGWAAAMQTGDMVLDQSVLREGDAFQVWQRRPLGALSIVDDRGAVAARSEAVPVQNSSALCRGVVASLAPGHYSVCASEGAPGLPLYVLRDNEEVVQLAQAADYLRALARMSGGTHRPFSEMEAFFPVLDLKERVELHRHVLQIWRSQAAMLFLLFLLSVEWLLRKYWRLV